MSIDQMVFLVSYRICGHILCVRCLCHSLLLIAFFVCLVFLLVLLLSVPFFVSPVKVKVCRLIETHDKMVPVDSTNSVLPCRWAINGALRYLNTIAFPLFFLSVIYK